jgi:hypothetical protein
MASTNEGKKNNKLLYNVLGTRRRYATLGKDKKNLMVSKKKKKQKIGKPKNHR